MKDYADEQKEEKWISVSDEVPSYDQHYTPAFSLLIKASNDRYYTGYSVTEYGKTTFYQYNGREILNVTHWIYLEHLKQK